MVCTDTASAVNWQCQVLIHTWQAVGGPGELIRLVAAPAGGPVPSHLHARVVRTTAPDGPPGTGDRYVPYNRLVSLQEWLREERPVGTVLVLDPDMVFRSAVTTRVAPGTAVVQRWVDFNASSPPVEVVARATGLAAEDLPGITWPALIHSADLQRLLPRWIELTAEVRRRTAAWESDMYGFVGAVAESGLTVTAEVLAAWLNWPEADVAGAPIIHYCQAVEGRDGAVLWSKWDYRPWEPIDVDPGEARLDYCRDLLAILADAVTAKAR